MSPKALLPAMLAAASVMLALLVAGPTSAAQADPVRIMPLGDSITGSPGCWRALLWNRLQSAGHTGVDFVGTQTPQGCSVAHDGEHEGHGGALVTTVADQDQLPAWLSAARPDVVLMHFGTNDVWSNRSPATILAAYGKLVDQMRASNPGMKVLVAQIIPMNPTSCADCARRVTELNAAIPGWAAGKSTARSPIVVVDQWTGFSTATDTYDGVHPNAAGDRKMADRWFPALTAALGGTSPTSTSTTTTTTTTSTTTTTTAPPPGCAVEIKVVGRWSGGFQLEVTFRNAGAQPIGPWSVRFALAQGMSITQAWNGAISQSGLDVTVRPASWNSTLPPGGTATVGMIGSGDPTGWTPVPICG